MGVGSGRADQPTFDNSSSRWWHFVARHYSNVLKCGDFQNRIHMHQSLLWGQSQTETPAVPENPVRIMFPVKGWKSVRGRIVIATTKRSLPATTAWVSPGEPRWPALNITPWQWHDIGVWGLAWCQGGENQPGMLIDLIVLIIWHNLSQLQIKRVDTSNLWIIPGYF